MNAMQLRLAVLGGLLVVAGIVGWQYLAYAGERARIDERIKAYSYDITRRDRAMEERAKLRRDLKTFAGSTFGTDEEKVTASLRKSLNEMIAHFGLIEASVSSAKGVGVRNPAAEARVSEFTRADQKAAARAADFYEVAATLTAKGTLEQSLRVLATLQVQPWVHRIDGFSLKPAGKERDRVEVSVMLTTLYLTDSGLKESASEPGWRPVREAEFGSWMPIVVKNCFKETAPPTTAVASAQPPVTPVNTSPSGPPPPPPPPYDEWRISGVASGAKGPILMLVNEKTREWRTIDAGGMILDATFVSNVGEVAEIVIANERYNVRTGQRLSERVKIH